MANLPARASIRLKGYDYSGAGGYFVTLCINHRLSLLGDIVIRESVVGADPRVCPASCEAGGHVGAQAGGHVGPPLLGSVVQWFKTMTTNEYIRGVKDSGWPRFEKRLWQRNYWEHIVRDNEWDNLRSYIWNNPLHWAADKLNPHHKMS